MSSEFCCLEPPPQTYSSTPLPTDPGDCLPAIKDQQIKKASQRREKEVARGPRQRRHGAEGQPRHGFRRAPVHSRIENASHAAAGRSCPQGGGTPMSRGKTGCGSRLDACKQWLSTRRRTRPISKDKELFGAV